MSLRDVRNFLSFERHVLLVGCEMFGTVSVNYAFWKEIDTIESARSQKLVTVLLNVPMVSAVLHRNNVGCVEREA